jgi:hypothetical protein
MMKYHMAHPRTLLFSPYLPTNDAVIEKIRRHLGYDILADSVGQADLGVYWDADTWRDPPTELLRVAAEIPVLNIRCRDISKTRVDHVFDRVFGRSLRVDPRAHVGRFVVKSDVNAMHDGFVVEQPVDHPARDVVYQRLVDNQVDREFVVDLRTPVIGATIPLVYKLYRPIASRFDVNDSSAEIAEPTEVFTDEEIAMLLRFTSAMGIDCGELDVLRDRDDGQVWVVAANPTAWGPPRKLGPVDQHAAIDRLSAAFASLASERIEAHYSNSFDIRRK